MIYLQLFWSFFQVGLFSFGGGYAAMPLIQGQLVDANGWFTLTEFAGLVAISEMTPGPIAINAATFAGYQTAGVLGAIVATLGCIAPACIIVSLLAWVFSKYGEARVIKGALAGLRPAVTALILSAGASLLMTAFWGQGVAASLKNIDPAAVLLFGAGLFCLRKFKASPILIMLLCGILGAAFYLTTM